MKISIYVKVHDIFETVLFCPIIEETNWMDKWLNFWFIEKPRSFWIDEIKSLLKQLLFVLCADYTLNTGIGNDA